DVIVDTGSSFTWIGADPKNPYVQGPSSFPTGQEITINYIRSEFKGNVYTDSVTLEISATSQDSLTINAQEIGVATIVTHFPRLVDGILGLGRKEASVLRDKDGNRFPPVFENLYTQRAIRSPAFGVYFIPLNERGVGEISFGYYNEAVMTSGLNYVHITDNPRASNYWGIDASFMYGGRTILNPTSGIIDTGSRSIRMPKDAVMQYQSDTGATVSPKGLLTIRQDQYDNLQTLSIIIGGQSYDLSPNAQVRPRPVSPRRITLVVGFSSSSWDFTLGHPFVQRYYVAFNATSSQIGFASTHYTGSTSN
ncbi:hypothetical protein ID866_9063, partial [Astraeus odoratus]